MIKQIFILCILTLYLLASCRVALPLMEYAVQYDYIATELCENKDKPELDCCGKCYVKKKITHAEETDSSKPPSSKDRQLEIMMHLLVTTAPTDSRPLTMTRSPLSSVTPRLLLGFDSRPSQPPEA